MRFFWIFGLFLFAINVFANEKLKIKMAYVPELWKGETCQVAVSVRGNYYSLKKKVHTTEDIKVIMQSKLGKVYGSGVGKVRLKYAGPNYYYILDSPHVNITISESCPDVVVFVVRLLTHFAILKKEYKVYSKDKKAKEHFKSGMEENNHNKAIRHFARVVYLKPKNHNAYFEMAKRYKKLSDQNKSYALANINNAIRFAKKALNIAPNNAKVNMLLGSLYVDKALILDPTLKKK